MTKEELFEAWAPGDSVWSQWTKPVLFAQIGTSFEARVAIPPPPPGFEPTAMGGAAPEPMVLQPSRPLLPEWRANDVTWAPMASEQRDTAIIVDRPGITSLAIGVALTLRGYRPVPLYNACQGMNAVCNLAPHIHGLETWIEDVRAASLPPDAPPAFLIDSDRLAPGRTPGVGSFDNRWVVFPQDFPSASFLQSRGIRRVLVVNGMQPQEDLSHVLLRWQEAGIAIELAGVGPIQVKKPSGFRRLWARILVAMGLRRSSAGGFGAMIPVQSSGGGYH